MNRLTKSPSIYGDFMACLSELRRLPQLQLWSIEFEFRLIGGEALGVKEVLQLVSVIGPATGSM